MKLAEPHLTKHWLKKLYTTYRSTPWTLQRQLVGSACRAYEQPPDTRRATHGRSIDSANYAWPANEEPTDNPQTAHGQPTHSVVVISSRACHGKNNPWTAHTPHGRSADSSCTAHSQLLYSPWGPSIENPRKAHGRPMDGPWTAYGQPTNSPRTYHGQLA